MRGSSFYHDTSVNYSVWNKVLNIELNINKRLSNHGTSDGSIEHVRYITEYSNMTQRLSVQLSIFGAVFFVSKSFGISKTKETLKILPKSLGAMLEY